MYELCEFFVAFLLIATTWGLVWASDFNDKVINKEGRDA